MLHLLCLYNQGSSMAAIIELCPPHSQDLVNPNSLKNDSLNPADARIEALLKKIELLEKTQQENAKTIKKNFTTITELSRENMSLVEKIIKKVS